MVEQFVPGLLTGSLGALDDGERGRAFRLRDATPLPVCEQDRVDLLA